MSIEFQPRTEKYILEAVEVFSSLRSGERPLEVPSALGDLAVENAAGTLSFGRQRKYLAEGYETIAVDLDQDDYPTRYIFDNDEGLHFTITGEQLSVCDLSESFIWDLRVYIGLYKRSRKPSIRTLGKW